MTEHIDEQWRTVSRNQNYLVSNMGRVSNARTGRILKGCTATRGNFIIVNLYMKAEMKTYYVHHLVADEFLEKPESDRDLIVAHTDNDTTNNEHTNLRYMTVSQRQMSIQKHKVGSSRFKGVSWVIGSKDKWAAHITLNKSRIHLGTYEDEEEAALAYDLAARDMFGEYARLNNV